jgi:hypothetical protein
VTVALPVAPAVNVTGLPATANPGLQQSLQVALGAPYPVDVNVTATLTFAADSGPDDPAIQFAAGGRMMQVTIPSGSTAPSTNIALQTGTVAGTITITFRLAAASSDITPTPVPVRTVRINAAAPVLSTVTAVRNATGFTVAITGFSSSRDMTQGLFQFNPTAGSNLQTTQLTVSVDAVFSQYYGSSAAAPFGSQFTLTQPFTVQGSTQSIQSVTVTLVNRVGNSNVVTANLQ